MAAASDASGLARQAAKTLGSIPAHQKAACQPHSVVTQQLQTARSRPPAPQAARQTTYRFYKDTNERRLKETPAWPSRAYRDLEIQQTQDAWRSVDYLETRPDIDKDKLA